MMNKVLFVPAGMVAFWAAHNAGWLEQLKTLAFASTPPQNNSRNSQSSEQSSAGTEEPFDLEIKQLYSYEKNETHCPDREMRHPCTTELRKYLDNKKGPQGEKNDGIAADRAYECSKTVYQQMGQDYNVVKNMTHLLLDLDVSEHKFDVGAGRGGRFYKLGLDFGRALINHPECMGEFDWKGAMECRCPMLYGKIILLKLKNAGRWEDAQALFDELRAIEFKGSIREYKKGEAIKWRDIQQTPQTFIENLAAHHVWPESRRKDLPIWDVLEDNFPLIRDEIATLYEDGKRYDPAYRFLFKNGLWDQVLLFHGRVWEEKNCELLPKICALLKKTLPARKVHHYPWMSSQNEQVVILRVSPGTEMETHSGPANNILNVHLGVSGVEGAVLTVANQTYTWTEGKVIPWDGSFDHSVHCVGCKQDRVIMMIRYMHPDITPKHYVGMGNRTAFEDIPEGFGTGEGAGQEL